MKNVKDDKEKKVRKKKGNNKRENDMKSKGRVLLPM